MSILIKGMEMPKNCEECRFDAGGYCTAKSINFLDWSNVDDQPKPSWCPLTKLITIEELMEPMCDQCQWPGWYKDPDDMQREKCSDCPVEAKLAEALYDDA